MSKTQNIKTVVILNNLRSSENVGSIFRSCDATGVSRIVLSGYTPAPLDRFGRDNKGLLKASLGAEKNIKWEKAPTLSAIVKRLKKEGFKTVGVEQDKRSMDYRKLKSSKILAANSNLALIFGNEYKGLSKKDLGLCDAIVELPMLGKKESLNVAVCAGIVLYSLI